MKLLRFCFAVFFFSPSFVLAQDNFDPRNPSSIERLKKNRDRLRKFKNHLETRYKEFGDIPTAMLVSRLAYVDILYFGRPGGAKSSFIDCGYKQDREDYFKLQLSSSTPDFAIMGAPSLNALQEGRYEQNLNGTLGESTRAFLDEADQGNHEFYRALFGPLNEREVAIGSRNVPIRTRHISLACNKHPHQIMDIFRKRNEYETFSALFNRIEIKAYIKNFISLRNREKLDQELGFAWFHEDESEDLSQLETNCQSEEPIEWEFLRSAGAKLFKRSPSLIQDWNQFYENIETSMLNEMSVPRSASSKYIPTVIEFSERLRQMIIPIVSASAFLDFLLSPLADDENLELYFTKKITVDYLSLYRSYLVFTVVMSGENKTELSFPMVDGKKQIKIDFASFLSKQFTMEETDRMKDYRFEQSCILKEMQNLARNFQENVLTQNSSDQEQDSFEILMRSQN